MTGVQGARSPRVAAQRGISMVVVVIMVVFTIVLCGAAILLWADMQEKQKILVSLSEGEWAKAKSKDKSLERNLPRELQLKMEIDHVSRERVLSGDPVGFPAEGEGNELAPAKTLDYMKKKRADYVLIKEAKDAKKQEDSNLYTTLQEIVELVASRVVQGRTRVEQLELEKNIAGARLENRKAIAPDLKKKKDEYYQDLQGKIAKLNEDITKAKTAFDTKKAEIDKVRTEAEEAATAEAAKFEEDKTKFENEIRELSRQLEELKIKEIIKHDVSTSHGRILNPDAENKVAFIDIGSRERVVPGLKFLVAKRGELGKFEYKGEVMVKKVWMTYAEVSIQRVYSKDTPIVEGDFIVNPLFSKDRPVVVCFAGVEKPLRLKYSTDEATRRIREIGSEVRKDLTLDVDYVIFTETDVKLQENQYPNYQKAVVLEVPIDRASEIYRFLGD